ncbi:MAG: tRNA (adenosine(37)-N6)-threonylcarbamoyltransferase complex ATPase subunit type 1 TsaE [Bacteroidetes bacterium]|nr:tRNA (adenosine(37)-N6)-threonylcarbamoyltransferase complex ATPase subunit type 1 TsaE [Bacteroidota bacterium]
MNIIIRDKRHLHSAAKELINNTGENKILAFYGAMGAGKTTIIKAICEVLGAIDIVTSPTFTLVNEYKTSSGESLFHFDFYRIKKTEEVFDFGIEEYFSSNSYCFLEWPELVEEILPPETVRIRIEVTEDEQRILHLS